MIVQASGITLSVTIQLSRSLQLTRTHVHKPFAELTGVSVNQSESVATSPYKSLLGAVCIFQGYRQFINNQFRTRVFIRLKTRTRAFLD